MNSIASRPLLSGEDLGTAIDQARTELAGLLRGSEDIVGTGGPKAVAEARALLAALLDRRVTEAAARMDERDARAASTAPVASNSSISCPAGPAGRTNSPSSVTNHSCSRMKPSPPGLPGLSFGAAMYPSTDIDM